ncbi:MAG: zinc ribbon domain-containing protein [Catenisphaera adipataccumulans]|jgi:hypothetical protein|uniref:zinc ribbon domain-containing protein n=1 Tax=Catenisphaera adipataccumulans TaxID=700500 RepID=UPI003D936B07
MFFMIGFFPREKEIAMVPQICFHCGSYGSMHVFVRYNQLVLFFIPVWKGKKEYYVQTTCCGGLFALDPAVGQRLERGEDVSITAADVEPLNVPRVCPHCHRPVHEQDVYCPYCGSRL